MRETLNETKAHQECRAFPPAVQWRMLGNPIISASPAQRTALGIVGANLARTLPMGRVDVQRLPGCPDLVLALINSDFPTGPLPPDVMRAVVAEPAYWSLCWGSGLGLARLLYERPELVRGRRVLDIGAGSGVAAIAAARNGAREVVACDTDADALAACACNAALNGVRLTLLPDLAQVDARFDVVTMADVLYDRSNTALLQRAGAFGDRVIVADSRVTELPFAEYRLARTIDTVTFPNLGEFDEFLTVRIWIRDQEPGAADGASTTSSAGVSSAGTVGVSTAGTVSSGGSGSTGAGST
jgi:predicted nicotinamide N-methyase